MRVSVNGAEAFIDNHGQAIDPAQPTILWIPGAGMEGLVWSLQARHFAFNGYNSLSVTRPGHGQPGASSCSDGPLNSTVEEEADWLVALLDALGLKSATVIGHSLGGLIAIDFAARHADRTDKVVLIASSPAIPVNPALVESARSQRQIADDLIAGWGHGKTGHFGGNQAIGGWMMGTGRMMLYRQADGVLHSDLAMCAAYASGEERAAAITAETLILLADKDRMTPLKAGRKLAELIPESEMMIIENCGHAIPGEEPDITLSAIKEFLS